MKLSMSMSIALATIIITGSAQDIPDFMRVTQDGEFKELVNVYGWEPGKDFYRYCEWYRFYGDCPCQLEGHLFLVPWNGEDSIDLKLKDGLLFANGELIGADLDRAYVDDPSKIITAQTTEVNLTKLPQFSNLKALRTYGYTGGPRPGSADYINQVSNLQALIIQETAVRPESLANFVNLRLLVLHNKRVKDEFYPRLETASNLCHLEITECYEDEEGRGLFLTDEHLASISEMFNLRVLKLDINKEVTREGLRKLQLLTNLRELDLGHRYGIWALDYPEGLSTLNLRYAPREAVDSAAGKKNIRTLHLGSSLSREEIDYLKSFPNLVELHLYSYHADSLFYLAELTNLRKLTIHYKGQTGKGLENLAVLNDLPYLEDFYLEILTSYNSKRLLAYLDSLPNVSRLYVGDYEKVLTDQDLKPFVRLGNIREIYLSLGMNKNITDQGLSYLSGLTNMRFLDLYATRITDVGLAWLKGLTNLRYLNLGATNITDKGMRYLKGMSNLKGLNLQSVNIGDEGAAYLTDMKRLKELDLFRANLTDKGAAYLAELSSLEFFNLMETSITDDGLRHLSGLSNMRYLWLERVNITDVGLKHLEPLTNLRRLWLPRSLGKEAVSELDKALPLWEMPYWK